MGRSLALLLLPLVLAGCESKSSAPAAGAAPSSSQSGADDLAPAVEVKPSKPPKLALSKLDDKALSTMVTRTGFMVTIAGHTPGGVGESAYKVGGYRKDTQGSLECTVLVRCGGANEPAPTHEAGTAYFVEGSCQMSAEVRRGILKKSAESKRLLEELLAQ